MVLEAGGRIYLGKDSSVEAATFRAMYPQLERWLETKAKYDPRGVFTSDLARRVGLVSAAKARSVAVPSRFRRGEDTSSTGG